MINITKNLMSVTLSATILAGSFWFCNTIEASPHNNIVYTTSGETCSPESKYPQEDNKGKPEKSSPPIMP